MRVLIVPSWYPTSAKPLNGIFVREQADALSDAHEVQVLYLDVLPRGKPRLPLAYRHTERGYVEEFVEVPNVPLVWQFIYLARLAASLRRVKREFQPDLVHCHVAVPAGWGVALLRGLLGMHTVLTEHSGDVTTWLRRPGLRVMARQAFRGADCVIAVSEWQKAMLRRHFPSAKQWATVPNAVDTSLFHPVPFPPAEDGYRVVFVALLESTEKGLGVLLEAMATVKQDAPFRVELSVVGDGTLREIYETQARERGIEDRVVFHGYRPHTEVPPLLQESHALVLPSFYESQSLAMIEALACGRPVVATRCGGPNTLVNDTNGLLVPVGKAQPMAEAIIRLLGNLDYYDPVQIGEEARERYSYEALVANLSEVYRVTANKGL